MAKRRLEKSWSDDLSDVPIYYLDLIKYREVSNYIADTLKVYHQSPQLILIENGTVVYNCSHSAIRVSEIASYT